VKLSSRLGVVLLLILWGASSIFGGQASSRIALTHVTVIDSTANSPRTDQTVVIDNGRIVEMLPSARGKLPKGARIIDGQGKFLIPGFWDMHVHVAGLNADPAWSKQVLLPLLVANGVTGVRDMGGDLDALLAWRREIENGTLVGPHIVASGPFLVSSGKKTAEQYPVANVVEARAAVSDLKRRGADFVKIISLPSKEVFFAVADEAKKQGIPFAGHLPFQVSAVEASDAGICSIEH
jgi:imidazolonepropionase-like amidohydrolase